MNDLFSGKDKTEIAIDRLKAFCPPEGYYVAFSGGKDSIVILDLVKQSGCKFDAHYSLTTVDPPELVKFIKTFPEVQFNYPEITMWKLIVKKRMPPTRLVRYCCEYFKEGGGVDRTILTGVRWAESFRRSKRKMVEACYRDSRKHYIHPIIDWTENDVWNYIRNNNLKYCHLYDEGFKRLGCIGCPIAGEKKMAEEFLRWPKYKTAYIKAFDRCVEKRITDGLKTEWTTGQQMFDWWMKINKTIKETNQTEIEWEAEAKRYEEEELDETIIFE
jgi:phosphoadenosine phosphosulfate reductase